MKVTMKLIHQSSLDNKCVFCGMGDENIPVYDVEILAGQRDTKQIARFNACPVDIQQIKKGLTPMGAR
jgi:hypothetical protein